MPKSLYSVVATHNIMQGHRLARLLRHYRALRDAEGLGVLCVQENGRHNTGAHAEAIAEELNAGAGEHDFQVACHADEISVATIYDRKLFTLEDCHLVSLPQLDRLTWWEKLYIHNGLEEQKHALLSTFRHANGAQLTVANFHLEAAGGNAHRRQQMELIADALQARGLTARLSACGDANSFAFRRHRQADALRYVLEPVSRYGAVDEGGEPTHFFARQYEPKLIKRICVWLGKLGIDLPGRYDVVCTNMPVVARGQVRTLDSDHDMVWAKLALG